MQTFDEIFLRLLSARDVASAAESRRRFSPDAFWISGLETLAPGDRYHWDGQKRGGDPSRPFVVFQVTLAGHGVYESIPSGETGERITTGRAFAAVVPGAHRYYLPPGSAEGWTYFWIMIRHPYVVARIAERQRAHRTGRAATILDLTPESALLARALSIFSDDFPDAFSEEEACFAFLTEFERHVAAASSRVRGAEGDDAARMLARARALFQAAPTQAIGVADLARAESMSRTRYSHRFKGVTGQPPGQYIVQIRLEEVARRLAQTDATLARIAADTGFADANHLCKAFRRRFHVSPGAYRRQMR